MAGKVRKCELCRFAGICTPSLCPSDKQVFADKINALDEIIEIRKEVCFDDFGWEVEQILKKYNLLNKEENV